MKIKIIGSCSKSKRNEPQQRDNDSPNPRRPGGNIAECSGGLLTRITRRSLSEVRRNPVNPDVDVFTHYFSGDLIIGAGGFGNGYEGILDENVRSGYKKTTVAIKVLDHESVQGDTECVGATSTSEYMTLPWNQRVKIKRPCFSSLSYSMV